VGVASASAEIKKPWSRGLQMHMHMHMHELLAIANTVAVPPILGSVIY
jgi:hypothetical protein